jgi:hypothetical protein
MKVRILKACYCVHLKRQVQPGEIIECPSAPNQRAIEAGLITPVIEIPDCPFDLEYDRI